MNLTSNTTIVAFTIDANLFSAKNPINEIKITAKPPTIIPLSGIFIACNIPPSPDSLRAQRAVSLSIATEDEIRVSFCLINILQIYVFTGNSLLRYFPVHEFWFIAISSGVPNATISPPFSPASGPRSII